MRVLSNETIKSARKEHQCDFCGGVILKGTSYHKQICVDDGIQSYAMHNKCQRIIDWYCKDTGEYGEIDTDYLDEWMTDKLVAKLEAEGKEYHHIHLLIDFVNTFCKEYNIDD